MLCEKGYHVRRELTEEQHEFWYAEKEDQQFIALDIVALLGLVALYEARGENWRAEDEQIDRFLSHFSL